MFSFRGSLTAVNSLAHVFEKVNCSSSRVTRKLDYKGRLMGPFIVIDKSFFESLSRAEIPFLFKHFTVVLSPVLLMEILADLRKKPKEDRIPEELVRLLARKVLETNAPFSADRRRIALAELLGQRVDRTAIYVEGGRVVDAPGLGKGIVFDESAEHRAVRFWFEGKFTDADRELAAGWRAMIQGFDLESLGRELRARLPAETKTKDAAEASAFLDRMLSASDPEVALSLLIVVTADTGADIATTASIVSRWHGSGRPPITAFASFNAHCAKVRLMFLLGLRSGWIGPRKSNVIDMEYYCYAKQTMIFASSDDLHMRLAPGLLDPAQTFVNGRDLKCDLEWLQKEWDGLTDEQREEREATFGDYPPEVEFSITHGLWLKYARPRGPESGNKAIRMSKEEEAALIAKFKPALDAIKRSEKREGEG